CCVDAFTVTGVGVGVAVGLGGGDKGSPAAAAVVECEALTTTRLNPATAATSMKTPAAFRMVCSLIGPKVRHPDPDLHQPQQSKLKWKANDKALAGPAQREIALW